LFSTPKSNIIITIFYFIFEASERKNYIKK